MKVKELDGWPPQWQSAGHRPAARLTGIGLDRRKPGMLVLSIEVGGQTSFGVLRLDQREQWNVFAALGANTGETLGEIGEVSLDGTVNEIPSLKQAFWERISRTAQKYLTSLSFVSAEGSREGPK